MRKKKITAKRLVRKHKKLFDSLSVKYIYILGMLVWVILSAAVYKTFMPPSHVLGDQTSLYTKSCSFWNVFCWIPTLFSKPTSYSRQNIPTPMQPNTTTDQTMTNQTTTGTTVVIAPTQSPIPTSAPIPGYRYYFDKAARYSIQYPQDTIPTEDIQPATNGQTMQTGPRYNNGVILGLTVRTTSNGLYSSGSPYSLTDFVNKVAIPSDQLAQSLHRQITLQQQTFGPNQAVVVSGLTDGTTAFVLDPYDNLRIFAFIGDGGSTASTMISSFRIAPPSTPAPIEPTTDFEMYTNHTFHFSLKYPKNTFPGADLPINGIGTGTPNLVVNPFVQLPAYSQGTPEEQNSVIFSGNNTEQLQLFLGRNTTGQSLEQFVKQSVIPNQPYLDRDKINTYIQTFVNHQGVVAENLTDGRGTTVFFQNGTLVFSLSLGKKGSLSNLPTLSTIASSLSY